MTIDRALVDRCEGTRMPCMDALAHVRSCNRELFSCERRASILVCTTLLCIALLCTSSG